MGSFGDNCRYCHVLPGGASSSNHVSKKKWTINPGALKYDSWAEMLPLDDPKLLYLLSGILEGFKIINRTTDLVYINMDNYKSATAPKNCGKALNDYAEHNPFKYESPQNAIDLKVTTITRAKKTCEMHIRLLMYT